MSRQLPTECDHCGKVTDWGDFGPSDDNLSGTTCSCECMCESRRVQRVGGPVTEMLLHPVCPFHGVVADPETWTEWRSNVMDPIQP